MKFSYYAKERNKYIRKISLLAKSNLLTFLKVAEKIPNLFSKHQIDSTTIHIKRPATQMYQFKSII